MTTSLCAPAGAAGMSIADVSQVYNEVVRELSLQLTLHEAAARRSASRQQDVQVLQQHVTHQTASCSCSTYWALALRLSVALQQRSYSLGTRSALPSTGDDTCVHMYLSWSPSSVCFTSKEAVQMSCSCCLCCAKGHAVAHGWLPLFPAYTVRCLSIAQNPALTNPFPKTLLVQTLPATSPD
jgi:hypothetical protein